MLSIFRLSRFLPTVRCLSAAATETQSVDKQALMKLRKRTGYSYVNCRKALVQFGPERLEEAEKWLKELAKKEGWAKAAKLSSRATSQGLVGVATAGTHASIVELTCETDFVARGDNFKSLLEQLTLAALHHAKGSINSESANIKSEVFSVDSLKTSDGQDVKEILTMAVGKLGENLSIKKVLGMCAPAHSALYCAAHPREGNDTVQMGKFASVVAMSREPVEGLFPTEKLAAQICQHIIGMRSECLGEAPTTDVKKEVNADTSTSTDSNDELNDFDKAKTTEIDDDETALLRQSFMLNPSQTVYEYVKGHRASVVDFVRTELGSQDD